MKYLFNTLFMAVSSFIALAISLSLAVILNLSEVAMLGLYTLFMFIPAAIIVMPEKEVR
ncbi:hypothetical protein [Macrococcus capreoli]|uniref:hypothetical protein n=1 Tax=Macrococcus capreoli TaxID=2982690 RepID=UPI003F4227C0